MAELPRSVGWLCGEDSNLKLFRIILCTAGSTVLAGVVALFGATWPRVAGEPDRRAEAGRTLFSATLGLYNLAVCVWLVVGTWSLYDYGCLTAASIAVATAGVGAAVLVNVAFTIVFFRKWSQTGDVAAWKAAAPVHGIVLVLVAIAAIGHLPALSLLESRLAGATSLSVPWPESGRAERLLWLRRCGLLALALVVSSVATVLYEVWSAVRCTCQGSLVVIVAVSLVTMLTAALLEWGLVGIYWIHGHILRRLDTGSVGEARQPLLGVNGASGGDAPSWVTAVKTGDTIVNG